MLSVVDRMLVLSRRIMARRPWVYWLLVIVVAAAMVVTVIGRSNAAQQAREKWSTEVTVWVATEPIAPGDDLTTKLESRTVPTALAPATALDHPDGTARQHIDVGSIATAADTGAGAGPLALVPNKWLVASIIESTPTGVIAGESVVIASDGTIIADNAIVIGHTEATVLVAVPKQAAPAVSMAAESGRISLLRAP